MERSRVRTGLCFIRKIVKGSLAILAIAATVTGIAIAQISLSASFSDETVVIGKNLSGDVTLGLQLYEGRPVAVGGVTGAAGDKFPFDSQGTLVSGGGFWKGMNSQYGIRLNAAQEKPKGAADRPTSNNQEIWIGRNAAGKDVQVRPDGTEIAPFILQQSDLQSHIQGAYAVLIASGIVRWNAEGRLSEGKDNLLAIRLATAQVSKITETKILDDGTLVVSTADGSKYKIAGFSCDFTATIEASKTAAQ
jgi:hypothetical protein